MATKQVFKEIQKSSTEKIIISESEWEDQSYLDLRIFYDASHGKGTLWKPTRKGITVRLELLEQLKEAIDAACEELT